MCSAAALAVEFVSAPRWMSFTPFSAATLAKVSAFGASKNRLEGVRETRVFTAPLVTAASRSPMVPNSGFGASWRRSIVEPNAPSALLIDATSAWTSAPWREPANTRDLPLLSIKSFTAGEIQSMMACGRLSARALAEESPSLSATYAATAGMRAAGMALRWSAMPPVMV